MSGGCCRGIVESSLFSAIIGKFKAEMEICNTTMWRCGLIYHCKAAKHGQHLLPTKDAHA